jgi:hypothetical protein
VKVTTSPPDEFATSPLYLLAILVSARRSGDRALERVTRNRLRTLGVQIAFDDKPTTAETTATGGTNAPR